MAFKLRQFIVFSFLSGLGWIFDFSVFTFFVKFFNTKPFFANFVSSYVGVTFVWFTSLNNVFSRTDTSRGRFLVGFWMFQLLSILVYSQCLDFFVHLFHGQNFLGSLALQAEILAKIVVTPFNLITNFIFMKFLTRFMRQQNSD